MRGAGRGGNAGRRGQYALHGNANCEPPPRWFKLRAGPSNLPASATSPQHGRQCRALGGVKRARGDHRGAHRRAVQPPRYTERHEVLLPEGADARFADSVVLWNAAEAAQRGKDAAGRP
jgi:hypothetical protein